MDTLHHLILKADQLGVLSPLLGSCGASRVTLYADNAVLFIRSLYQGCNMVLRLLQVSVTQ
jgi:hypothetical protein